MYKSRSVISSESESDEEPSPADKKTRLSKDTKKGTHVHYVYCTCVLLRVILST